MYSKQDMITIIAIVLITIFAIVYVLAPYARGLVKWAQTGEYCEFYRYQEIKNLPTDCYDYFEIKK